MMENLDGDEGEGYDDIVDESSVTEEKSLN